MKLDANGVNEYGVAMCMCGNKGPHAWEPGESCSPSRLSPVVVYNPARMCAGDRRVLSEKSPNGAVSCPGCPNCEEDA